jgi:hypothetical protein
MVKALNNSAILACFTVTAKDILASHTLAELAGKRLVSHGDSLQAMT